MSWIQIFLLCGSIGLGIRYAFILSRAAWLPNWIVASQSKNAFLCDSKIASGAARPLVYVVIPALNEYDSLPRTLKALAGSMSEDLSTCFRFVVVTTEKEREQRVNLVAELRNKMVDEPSVFPIAMKRRLEQISRGLSRMVDEIYAHPAAKRESRLDKVCSLIENWPYTWSLMKEISLPYIDVRWIHQVSSDGNMATQLNVVVEEIAKSEITPEETYFLCYNADTLPSSKSLQELQNVLVAKDHPISAQLMAVSMLNFKEFSNFGSAYAAGAAIYQSRWALGYEFSMLMTTNERRFPSLQSKYHYCRGHGMVFRFDFLMESGGFDENTALEDIFQGFKLSCIGEPCHPVPVLEWTESPSGVFSVIQQKKFWFSGMLDLPYYASMLPIQIRRKTKNARLFLLLFIGLYREIVTWAFGPMLVCLLILGGLLQGLPYLIALPILNAVISVVLVLRVTPLKFRPERPSDLLRFVPIYVVGTFIYSLTRNVGPLAALSQRLLRRSNNAKASASIPQNRPGSARA
ncbi:glycosyltransferase family 2 protein [Labrenzia sp. DG1229]|uniref:glycosyltransferase family 2 protein n=1 Tax=Labrenzia sp. DG1229 TaxID=681847 RepID=UPI00048FDB79|nr:glycosyltransferase family 2 protein [Labrenzia sp. DG1229]